MAAHTDFVASLSTGLRILRCFSEEQPVLTNGALSRMTGTPRSSVSRLTRTLVMAGFLEVDARTGAYRLGMGVVHLQSAALAGARLSDCVAPHLAELAERIRVRVVVTVYEDFGLTVLHGDCADPDIAGPCLKGHRYSLSGRAMGRACLATASSREQGVIVRHLAQGDGPRSRALGTELEQAVSSLRSHGYCLSLGEARPGNNSMSIALYAPHLGRRVFLGCGGPAERLPERALRDRIAPLLMQAGADIERSSARLSPARAGAALRH